MSSADSEFVGKYLESLERRDSRDGATRWVVIVAMAALAWKASEIAPNVDIDLFLEVITLSTSLYFLVGWVFIASPVKRQEVRGLRFIPRHSEGIDAILAIGAFTIGLLTCLGIFFLFDDVSSLSRILVIIPIAVFCLGAVGLLAELRQKYEVKRSLDFGLLPSLFVALIFVTPMLIGLFAIFNARDYLPQLIDSEFRVSFQFASISIALLFLAEKCLLTYKKDAEVKAVRRIWTRNGVGELSDSDALSELRLIIAGARLGEIVTVDLDAFSASIQSSEELESLTAREIDRIEDFPVDGSKVEYGAIKNSLQKRFSDLASLLDKCESDGAAILASIKKLTLGEDLVSEEAELRESISSRLAARRAAHEELRERVRVMAGADA